MIFNTISSCNVAVLLETPRYKECCPAVHKNQWATGLCVFINENLLLMYLYLQTNADCGVSVQLLITRALVLNWLK